jgi:CheY-like chemotaxis protein
MIDAKNNGPDSNAHVGIRSIIHREALPKVKLNCPMARGKSKIISVTNEILRRLMENITTPRQPQIKQRKDIVIVEPDDDFADFLMEVLRQETSYSVFRVASGERALQVVPQLKPDLLILNLDLNPDFGPDTNGFEVYDQLRTINDLVSLPTLLFNTNTAQQQKGPCNAITINTLFDVDYLLQTIDDLLT